MRFKKYLNKKISLNEDMIDFQKLIQKDYSEAFNFYLNIYGLAANDEIMLYRGIKGLKKKFEIVKPVENRIARDCLNFYNPIVNEHPSWSKFPKRGVICSTDDTTADNYGELFLVLPKNGTKIVICPASDFWFSFNSVSSLEEYSQLFTKILTGKNMSRSEFSKWKDNPENLKEVKAICLKIEKIIKKFKEVPAEWGKWKYVTDDGREISSDIWKKFNEYFNINDILKGKSLFDKLIENLSPKEFKIGKITDLTDYYEDCEVWFDEKYLVVDLDFFEEFIYMVRRNEI